MVQGFVTHALRVGYIPMLNMVMEKTVRCGVNDTAVVEEHVKGLVEFGGRIARVICRMEMREDSGLVNYKLANCVWGGVCGMLSSLVHHRHGGDGGDSTIEKNKAMVVEACECLMECMYGCVEMMGKGYMDEETMKKIFKFLVSNYGKIVNGEASSDVVDATVCRFWHCIGNYLQHDRASSAADGLVAFMCRALVMCMNKMSIVVDGDGEVSVLKDVLGAQAATTSNTSNVQRQLSHQKLESSMRVVIELCRHASECKMQPRVLRGLRYVVECMMQCLVRAEVQSALVVSDVRESMEDVLIEFTLCHLEHDVEDGIKGLFRILAFGLSAHPVIEDVLCRYSMRVTAVGGLVLQKKIVEELLEMTESTIGFSDIILSPKAMQMINIASASFMYALVETKRDVLSVFETVAKDVMMDGCRIDVHRLCSLSTILRVIYNDAQYSPPNVSTSSSVNEYCTEFLRATVSALQQVSEKMATSRERSTDQELVLAWIADCTLILSKMTKQHSAALQQCIQNIQQSLQNRMDDSAPSDILDTASCLVARAEIIMSKNQRFVSPVQGGVPKKRINPMEYYDASMPSAGWLVQLAPQQRQRPISIMKRVFSRALLHQKQQQQQQQQLSNPVLTYLAMNAYVEYVQYCPGENVTAVLPEAMIDTKTGHLSDEFKRHVEQYVRVIKNIEGPISHNGTKSFIPSEEQRTQFMEYCWNLLEHQTRHNDSHVENGHRKDDETMDASIRLALQHAQKSIDDLEALMKRENSSSLPKIHKTAGLKRTFDDMMSTLSRLRDQSYA